MNQRLLRRGALTLVPIVAGTGVFQGYASLFGKRDQQGDIVQRGAFADCLKRRGVEGIRMLFQHNASEPIGTWIDIRETSRGLYVLGRLDQNLQRGRELLSLLESGGLDGLSIGFKTIRARNNREAKVRELLEIDLWEISLVTFPMLDGARVSAVRLAARARANSLFKPMPDYENNVATTL